MGLTTKNHGPLMEMSVQFIFAFRIICLGSVDTSLPLPRCMVYEVSH